MRPSRRIFRILNVAQNSHTLKPLIYKITGVWGNHEGSMLLWVLVLAVYSAAIAFSRRGSARLTSAALGVQGLLAAAFILFILFTSNPFLRLDPAPFEGAGLNPLLQDPGLALHPPMLYVGYVGLSAVVRLCRRRAHHQGTRLGRAPRGPSCSPHGSR